MAAAIAPLPAVGAAVTGAAPQAALAAPMDDPRGNGRIVCFGLDFRIGAGKLAAEDPEP